MADNKKGVRLEKTHKHLPPLTAAVQNRYNDKSATPAVDQLADAA